MASSEGIGLLHEASSSGPDAEGALPLLLLPSSPCPVPLPRRPRPAASSSPPSPLFFLAADAKDDAEKLRRGQLPKPRCSWRKVAAAAAAVDDDEEQ